MKIKYSTFIKILIIFVLLNIILGILIYSEVKQISNQEQMKFSFLNLMNKLTYLFSFMFLVIIAMFLLGYLIGHYKGFKEGWNGAIRINRIKREIREIQEKRKVSKGRTNEM